MRSLFRGFLIFLLGGALGTVFGIAVGFFLFPYVFPAPPAVERLNIAESGKLLATGSFIQADPSDPFHYGKGRVSVYERNVFLESDFEVGPGPAFHIYLVPKERIRGSGDLSGAMYVDLGGLRAFKGSQNYEIPQGLTLSGYPSVIIWCERFGVLISPADLSFGSAESAVAADIDILMHLLAGFADISLGEMGLVAAMALFGSLVGGIAGYGTGVLMPLVLVPIAGAEAIVPVIAISALFTNASRATAFRHAIDVRRALIVLVCAAPTCVLGAYGFTLLTGRGALILIGSTLILSVPLRRIAKHRGVVVQQPGLAVGSVIYGVLVGGTTGAGVILLSLLMASGLEGAAVIATDALISIALGAVKVMVFGIAGVLTPKVIAFALIIGGVAFPGAFLAKALVERLPLHVHTTILDAVILIGGTFLIANAFWR